MTVEIFETHNRKAVGEGHYHGKKMGQVTGFELDQKLRAIMLAARPETVLSSTAQLVELGFPPRASFELVAGAIKNNPALQVTK